MITADKGKDRLFGYNDIFCQTAYLFVVYESGIFLNASLRIRLIIDSGPVLS